MPVPFVLLISVTDADAAARVRSAFSDVEAIERIEIACVPNRGRDIAPLLVTFRDELLGLDIVGHLHSKKSLHTGSLQNRWRSYLVESLTGDRDRIAWQLGMFAAEPTRVEADYAKWMLDDPRINFAISTRGGKPGVDHLGIQTDNAEELAEMKARAQAADLTLLDEGATSCCYARSEKHWVTDPQGIAWEHFHTLGDIPVFSEAKEAGDAVATSACCATPAVRGKPVGIAVKAASSCC
jgi:lactoylglutathione lyase